MVRAKFQCQSVDKATDGSGSIHLTPVYTGSEENKEFFKATPGGEITLQVLHTTAIDEFEEGKEYYVDFSKAE